MKNDLELLGIFDLRNYARALGVKKPTTKLKSQLIDEIIQIKNSNAMSTRIINRGRPPKTPISMAEDVWYNDITRNELKILKYKYNQLVSILKTAISIIED